MNRQILRLALPNIISNLSVPLLGMADIAIVGHLGGGSYIGAVAIGAAIFNLIYWNFGFLRMGTSAFTAQAYGARNFAETTNTLIRALTIALAIALLLIVLQNSLLEGALFVLAPSRGPVARLAAEYFSVRIWAAPATLAMYAFKGWFIGMQNAKTPMYIAIAVNLINIACSFLLVMAGWGVKGIAWGTVVAQYSGVVFSCLVIIRYYSALWRRAQWSSCFNWLILRRFFHVNSDIFLRTICLTIVFTFFTSASSSMGDDILAVNTLLMQLFTFFSYFMDGFAHAAEALVGKFTGARNSKLLKECIRITLRWGVSIAVFFALLYYFCLTPLLWIFTSQADLITIAQDFDVWIALVPLVGFAAFLYDGILTGATLTVVMRNCMLVASIAFFALYYGLQTTRENDALWISFIVYLALRGLLQYFFSRKKIFTPQ